MLQAADTGNRPALLQGASQEWGYTPRKGEATGCEAGEHQDLLTDPRGRTGPKQNPRTEISRGKGSVAGVRQRPLGQTNICITVGEEQTETGFKTQPRLLAVGPWQLSTLKGERKTSHCLCLRMSVCSFRSVKFALEGQSF